MSTVSGRLYGNKGKEKGMKVHHALCSLGWSLLLVPFLALGDTALAGYTTIQLTDNSYHEQAPQISDSGQVVWAGMEGNIYGGEIFLYSGGVTTQLTSNDYIDQQPQTNDSGQVVWFGWPDNNSEIFLYSDGVTTQLTDDISDDRSPQINAAGQVIWTTGSGSDDRQIFIYSDGAVAPLPENNHYISWPQINDSGQVVWYGFEDSALGAEIFLYSGGVTTQLTSNDYIDELPQINASGQVVWMGDDGIDSEIFLYSGGVTTQLTDNINSDYIPQINASGQVVWWGYDGNDYEIFLHSDGVTIQLTDNIYDDESPQINDSGQVVWWGYDGNDYEIFLYSGGVTTQLTDNSGDDSTSWINSSGQVVWMGDDGSDYEIFLAEPAINQAPVPTAPTMTIVQGDSGTSQISPNDPDVSDTHDYSISAPAINGLAVVSTSGLVTYTPEDGYVGTDSTRVTVTDQNGGAADVRIDITVTAETVPPTSSVLPPQGSYQEEVTVTLSATDNLDPSPVIHYTVDGSEPTQASPIYTAALSFTSTTTLKFFAVDWRGNAETVTTALYAINHAPKPTALDIIVGKRKAGTSQIDPGDPDVGDTHSYSMVLPPTNGAATVEGSGLVTYTPNSGFRGQDSLTVLVTDQNGGSGSVTITIYVADSPCTDEDRDGYSPEGGACGLVDCDPNNSDIHPDAVETCGNSVDENCNGYAEACTIHDVAVTSLRTPSKVRNCATRPKKVRSEVTNLGEFPEEVTVQLTINGTQFKQVVILNPGSVAQVAFTFNPSSLIGGVADICVHALIGPDEFNQTDNGTCNSITVVACQ